MPKSLRHQSISIRYIITLSTVQSIQLKVVLKSELCLVSFLKYTCCGVIMKQTDLVYYIIDLLRRLRQDMRAIRHQQSLILEFIGKVEVESRTSKPCTQLIDEMRKNRKSL